MWKSIAVTTDPVPDKQYGMNNFAAETLQPGASAWVGTADDDAKVGRTASRFDLWFLKQKKGGSFDVLLDSSFGPMFGGGAQVAFPNGLFAQVSYERFRKTGTRALVSGTQVFTIDTPLRITVTPLQFTVAGAV